MGVVVKNKVARFFMDHGVYMYRFYFLYLSSILCCNSPNKHI